MAEMKQQMATENKCNGKIRLAKKVSQNSSKDFTTTQQNLCLFFAVVVSN